MEPYGYPAAQLAEACGVDISTARKWKRAGRIPTQYHQWLKFYRGHDLGAFAKDWDGWRMHDGMLYSPEGDKFTPGAIRASSTARAVSQELQIQIADLINTIDSDHEHRQRLTDMETLQAAVHTASEALESLTSRFSHRDQRHLFGVHPQTQTKAARSLQAAEALQAVIAELPDRAESLG